LQTYFPCFFQKKTFNLLLKENKLTVPRTARYYTLGTPSEKVKNLWIVCHGYGQLAHYFLRHFHVLEDEETVIVAPEGLSRFYLEGFSGRVGATWMTKEDRIAEIKDQAAYLNLLLQEVMQPLSDTVKVHILGFSQGGATVCRWLATEDVPCHRLVLWAAAFPEDINFITGKAAFQHLPVDIVYGTKDAFITPETMERKQQLMIQLGITPRIHTFEGEHTLQPELLLKLKQQL
jgi:predicted esterase